MSQTKQDNKQKSSVEFRHKIETLYANQNNLGIDSLFNEYHTIWQELTEQNADSVSTFYHYPAGALNFLTLCKFLSKRQLMLDILHLRELTNLDNLFPQVYHECKFYLNWLWLALTEPNQKLEERYLSNFTKVYPRLLKRFAYNYKSITCDDFITRMHIEENLAYSLLKLPKPHIIFLGSNHTYPNNSLVHYEFAELLYKRNAGVVIDEDYLNLCSFLINTKELLFPKLICHTVSLFITQNMYHELYFVLDKIFNSLLETIVNANSNTDRSRLIANFLMPIATWLVRVGLILNKDKTVIDRIISCSQEMLSKKYENTNSSDSNNNNVSTEPKGVDTRLFTMSVFVKNCFNANSFTETKSSKAGEEIIHNACLLMNPHNPKFSPQMAIDLLKNAITNTHQFADSYLEYIRCNLLLDPQYAAEKDEFLMAHFTKYTQEPHFGFYWVVFSYYLDEYCNELQLLYTLEKKIKRNIEELAAAYNNPNNPDVLKNYPAARFLTAFGMPQQFTKERIEIHANDVVNQRAGRFNFFYTASTTPSGGQQTALCQDNNNNNL